MKVVINKCFGGYSISDKAMRRMCEIKGIPCYFFESVKSGRDYTFRPIAEDTKCWMSHAFSIPNPNDVSTTERNDSHISSRPSDRTDPVLIQVIEELGDEANGDCAKLQIIEIPDGIGWEISDYDGMESIEECHRSWG